jgi:hypothetical protein
MSCIVNLVYTMEYHTIEVFTSGFINKKEFDQVKVFKYFKTGKNIIVNIISRGFKNIFSVPWNHNNINQDKFFVIWGPMLLIYYIHSVCVCKGEGAHISI